MVTTTKIAIAGLGVVGKAVYNAFSPVFTDIKCYDTGRNLGDIGYVCEADVVFICVPADQVEELMRQVTVTTGRQDILFILKSTVVPGTTEKLQTIYGNHWVFSPEFLTERTANLDFINSPRFILGGTGSHAVDIVEDLYRERFRHTPIIKTTARTAEFTKFVTNMYFMNKIMFMNEMKSCADGMGIPWDSVMKQLSSDGRIETSHLEVPGPDGKMGFGGKCFPENINTWVDFTEKLSLNNDLMKKVRELNDIYRDE